MPTFAQSAVETPRRTPLRRGGLVGGLVSAHFCSHREHRRREISLEEVDGVPERAVDGFDHDDLEYGCFAWSGGTELQSLTSISSSISSCRNFRQRILINSLHKGVTWNNVDSSHAALLGPRTALPLVAESRDRDIFPTAEKLPLQPTIPG